MQLIVFTLNDKYYAINTEIVDEISKTISVTMVPNSPDWVEGLINLRGNVVTLVNSWKLLGQEETEICYNNIIIINDKDEKVGLMVKDVIEVVNIETEDIQNVNGETHDGILGIIRLDGKFINIIDISLLLSKNEG